MAFWEPQVGPQMKAAASPIDFTLFGGTRGGGKTDCLLGRHIKGVEQYGNHWNGLVVRRKYKEFAELRRRIDEMIAAGLPAERVGGDQQINMIRFKNGASVTLAAIQRLEFVGDFVGQQYTEISIDEATTFPFFLQLIDKLKGSLRSPHGVPGHMFATGNPGGPGHVAVKEYMQLGSMYNIPPETVLTDNAGETRIYIPSFLKDNKVLCRNDPKYVQRLLSIRDPLLRKAWLDGDWDVFIGQAFGFTQRHIIPPMPVPDYAPLYMTFDWGFGKPFSVGWWWTDADARLYRFAEWYGWNGTPDEGCRLTDEQIVEGIIEREKKLGIWGKQIFRPCDPTCFNKKPDYKGGGQGPSTAEVFARYQVYLTPGDPERKLKIRQFRNRLLLPENETELPMLVVYNTCKHFIRTIPALAVDDNNVEDVDTDSEDHCYDESALVCMARPLKLVEPKARQSEHDRRIAELIKPKRDSYLEAALFEHQVMQKQFAQGSIISEDDMDEYEDRGEMVDTVRG